MAELPDPTRPSSASRKLPQGRTKIRDIRFDRLLGEGAFAEVWLGRRSDQSQVAVKVMNRSKLRECSMEAQVDEEIRVQNSLLHPNCMPLLNAYRSRSSIYIVMPVMQADGLAIRLYQERGLPEGEARVMFQHVISGLRHMHTRRIYHRDLKVDNLLLTPDGKTLRLADFGLALELSEDACDKAIEEYCGTPLYAAPQIHLRKPYRPAESDMWSAGVILYLLLSGKAPWPWHDFDDMTARIIEGRYIALPSSISREARLLVHWLLQPNPVHRHTMEKVLQDSWFTVGYDPVEASTQAAAAMEELEEDEDVRTGDAGGAPAASEVSPAKIDMFSMLARAGSRIQTQMAALATRSEDTFKAPYTCFVVRGCDQPKLLVDRLTTLFGELNFTVKTKQEFRFDATHKSAQLRTFAGRGKSVKITIEVFQMGTSNFIEMNRVRGDVLQWAEMYTKTIKPQIDALAASFEP